MKKLVIYGAGAVGRLGVQIAQDMNRAEPQWEILGFIDDGGPRAEVAGYPVLGGADWLRDHTDITVAVAIGDPVLRRDVVQRLRKAGVQRFGSLIHPTCWIADRVTIGEGSILYPRVAIDPDVSLGAFAIVNKNATLGHDAVIGDFATFGPGVNLGGRARVGAGVFFGINSSTIQDVEVGEWCTIGSGATVTKSIAAATTAVGLPARPIDRTARLGRPVKPEKTLKLVIVGAGGQGVESAWLAMDATTTSGAAAYDVIGFLDDAPALAGATITGRRVVGTVDEFIARQGAARDVSFHCAIGRNDARKIVTEKLEAAGFTAVSLIASTATVAPSATIGRGCYVGHHVYVGPEARIGDHVLVNVNCSVGHHSVTGNFAQLCPGVRISGGCRLGEGVFLGSNAVMGPLVEMGAWSTLGAAAFARRNLPAGSMFAGNPARQLR